LLTDNISCLHKSCSATLAIHLNESPFFMLTDSFRGNPLVSYSKRQQLNLWIYKKVSSCYQTYLFSWTLSWHGGILCATRDLCFRAWLVCIEKVLMFVIITFSVDACMLCYRKLGRQKCRSHLQNHHRTINKKRDGEGISRVVWAVDLGKKCLNCFQKDSSVASM